MFREGHGITGVEFPVLLVRERSASIARALRGGIEMGVPGGGARYGFAVKLWWQYVRLV